MNKESIAERLRKRGEERFQNLVRDSGGVYSAQELAKLLNKPFAVIIEMACTRQLIGFKVKGGWLFPSAQLDGNELIRGMHEVLGAFGKDIDDVSIVLFFLSNYEGSEEIPLSLLKQGYPLEFLIQSARTLYEHGAR